MGNNFKIIENQKFDILVDGMSKEAEILKVIEILDKKYAIYAIESDEENSDIMASEIVTDLENNDTLKDIEDIEIKESILNIINEMLS